jgi:hypothetical protein
VNANKNNADFWVYKNGTISGAVFEDLDGDGVLTEGETDGVEGATVEIFQDDVLVDSEITESDGLYSFGDLTPGDYEVCQTPPSGWEQSVPPPDVCHSVALESEDSAERNFGDFEQGSISGTRLINGEGFPGQTVRLLDGEGNEVDSTTTNEDDPETPEDEAGTYEFTGLNPGDYTVCTSDVGDTTGTPGAPCETDEVGNGTSVGSGQDVTDIDFTDTVEGAETVTCGDTTNFDNDSGLTGSVFLQGCEGTKVVQFATDPDLLDEEGDLVNEVTYDTVGEGVEGGYALEFWSFPFVPAPAPGVDVFLYYDDGLGEFVAPFCLDDPRDTETTVPDGLNPDVYLPLNGETTEDPEDRHTTCIIMDRRTTKPGQNGGVPDVQGDFWLFSVGDPGRGFR